MKSVLAAIRRFLGKPFPPRQPELKVSREQLREALADMLADPQTRKLIAQSVLGCMAARGGSPETPARDVSSPGPFGADCSPPGGDYSFPAALGVGGALTVAGNVGIGTPAPAEKLEVAGKIKISGEGNGIQFPDETIQTTAAVSPGVENYIAVYSSPETLEQSTIYDTGAKIGIRSTDKLSTLTVRGNPETTASGLVSILEGSPSTVTGDDDTRFLSEVGLGDRVKISGQIRTVAAITDDHHLTVDGNFSFADWPSSVSMTIMPSIFRADDSSGNPKFIISDDGLIGLAGAPIHDDDAVGYVICFSDTRIPGTDDQTRLKDKNQEMRGYQSTMRYERTTADASIGGLGWDVFA
jgi:hypothetical protein